jgi:acetylornithine deacetylase/succinyl-diaminopimelate desuccinylase-like protein
VAEVNGKNVADLYPLVSGMRLAHEDALERVLAGTWRPALSVTGAGGLPQPADAGNVLRPKTVAKLSLRLPPTVDATRAARRVKETLETDAPYGARVTFEVESPGTGWDAPPTDRWLLDAMQQASRTYFGRPAMFQGVGGSIPFMAMLGERYPTAQFMITGVMGPGSNAHGPNEFVHLPTGVRVTACVADVLAAHARR